MILKVNKNKYITVEYSLTHKLFDIYNDNASKFISETYIVWIDFLKIRFSFIIMNYCKYIHVCLDENNINDYSLNIKRFMNVLSLIHKSGIEMDNKCKYTQYPFIFNYINNKFYITCFDRNWFLKHNLGSILQMNYPENYMDGNEMNLFPKI